MNSLIEEQERLEKGINECECDNKTGFAQLELGRCNICDVMFAKHEGIRFAGEEAMKIIDDLKDPYPLDIFAGLENEDVAKIVDLIRDNSNISLDRFSAHLMRKARKNVIEDLKDALGGQDE